jgi:hypothetical protein
VKTTHSTLIALATAVSLLPVFVVLAMLRLSDNHKHQVEIAHSVLTDVSAMISKSVTEKRRMVTLFATEHRQLLSETARDPDNEDLLQALDAKIRRYFPDYFAYSLTTTQGDPLIDDFDGKIGEICLSDMREFVASGKQSPRIHPNALAYHIDLIAGWQADGRDGLLLLSFHTQMLSEMLNATQPYGHQLMLVLPDQSNLIEVTASGDRLSLPDRLDFRLSEQERERVLAGKEIADTRWQILDLQQPEAFAAVRTRVFVQMATVYALFLVVVALLWFFLRRYELQRQQLAGVLADKNRILEDENQLALGVYERITSNSNEYIDALRVHHVAKLSFSGDIYLCSGKDRNRFYFLLADFTGHGLGAALGAIPLADVFFDCAKRQCPADELIRLCNEKLLETLPTERFCCACLVLWDKTEKTLTVCNAGLPDACLVGSDNSLLHTFPSTMPPLGVTGISDVESRTVAVVDNSHLVGYTDGVIEAVNANGELFGDRRLLACIESSAPGDPYTRVLDALAEFSADAQQVDDISLFQLSTRT